MSLEASPHHLDGEILCWLMSRKYLFGGLGCRMSDKSCTLILEHIAMDGVSTFTLENDEKNQLRQMRQMNDGFTKDEIDRMFAYRGDSVS